MDWSTNLGGCVRPRVGWWSKPLLFLWGSWQGQIPHPSLEYNPPKVSEERFVMFQRWWKTSKFISTILARSSLFLVARNPFLCHLQRQVGKTSSSTWDLLKVLKASRAKRFCVRWLVPMHHLQRDLQSFWSILKLCLSIFLHIQAWRGRGKWNCTESHWICLSFTLL